MLNSQKLGTVFTFQNITDIQEVECKIRTKIYSNGYVAKYTFEDIIGKSKNIVQVIQKAKTISQAGSNVLLAGESGTGKELFAQSIHNYSSRKNGTFVAVNCAALPEIV